eukprot:SAG31_NODE_22575_length_522_cov_1.326241_1_plen_56_part_00
MDHIYDSYYQVLSQAGAHAYIIKYMKFNVFAGRHAYEYETAGSIIAHRIRRLYLN